MLAQKHVKSRIDR